MAQLSTAIVDKFIREDLIPNLNRALKSKQTVKGMIKRMPKLVTNSIIKNVLESSVKISNDPGQLSPKSSLRQVQENSRQEEHIKVPKRKHHSVFPIQSDPYQSPETTKRSSLKSNSRITTQCSNLVKLVESEEEESEEVKKLRKIKQMMRKYQENKEKNRVANEHNRKIGVNAKKSTLNQCMYHHTYGYQSDIIEVNPLHLQTLQECDPSNIQHTKSLLEVIKTNLDEYLENQKQKHKLLEIQQLNNRKKIEPIPECKINTIQEEDGQYKVRDKKVLKLEKKSYADPSLRPLYKFQQSHIHSLSSDIDNSLSEGIKMITLQQKIVKKEYPHIGYNLNQVSITKSKPRRQKQNTSQSVVYLLENQLKNQFIGQSYVNEAAQSQVEKMDKYGSLQFSRAEDQCDALTQFLKRSSNGVTLDTDSRVNEMKLPEIGRRKRNPPKRTATEQKMKGLEGIEVQVNTPQNKEEVHFSHRSRHFSALSLNRQTESSLEEENSRQGSGVSLQRSKKEMVRDYFKNYKEQFRQKMRRISHVINLYS